MLAHPAEGSLTWGASCFLRKTDELPEPGPQRRGVEWGEKRDEGPEQGAPTVQARPHTL